MKKIVLSTTLILWASTFTFAQSTETTSTESNSTETSISTLQNKVDELEKQVNTPSKLKFSGYIQAQFQHADTLGANSFAGGDFVTKTNSTSTQNIDNRFMVRRGRLKATYTNNNAEGLQHTSAVLQIDVTEKGLAIKEAFLKFTEQQFQWLSLTAGVFNRPFGQEIEYSSSLRESPERSRMFQTLFPGERDLGAMLTIQAPKTNTWTALKLDAAIVNGCGEAATDFSDFDKYKDFIGHLSYTHANKAETFKFIIGASTQQGGYKQNSNSIYTFSNNVFTKGTGDSTTIANAKAPRKYYGVDFSTNWVTPIGLNVIRAEYITGTQTGTSSYNGSKNPSIINNVGTSLYVRDFTGFDILMAQNIGTSKHKIVLKYDMYDPNNKIKGMDIGATGSNTNAGDIKFSTIGFGYILQYNENLKFTIYEDIVTNEKTNVTSGLNYSRDVKDNVFTLRAQYKF